MHDEEPTLSRRALLKAAGAAAVGVLAGGCLPAPPRTPPSRGASASRALSPVHVAPDRVIRTVVGLRPYRRTGFRVEAEALGDKRVVHNYGHGGCGVTLSWGSAELAVERAGELAAGPAAVIGCGAVGLATARLLQRRGAEVTIYARDLPPRTTSNVAGASWYPSLIVHPDHRTPAFETLFERAARLSHRHFQEMVGDRYGVRWLEQYWLAAKPFEWGRERALLADLFPATRVLGPDEHPFAAGFAIRDTTMLIEPHVYLQTVMEDFLLAGGRIEPRAFAGAAELLSLPEPLVLNCTGLGAAELFGDEDLIPIRGQLSLLLPQPEVDYIVARDDLYMFPRRDGIVLGGTFEPRVTELAPDPEAAARVLRGHAELFGGMEG